VVGKRLDWHLYDSANASRSSCSSVESGPPSRCSPVSGLRLLGTADAPMASSRALVACLDNAGHESAVIRRSSCAIVSSRALFSFNAMWRLGWVGIMVGSESETRPSNLKKKTCRKDASPRFTLQNVECTGCIEAEKKNRSAVGTCGWRLSRRAIDGADSDENSQMSSMGVWDVQSRVSSDSERVEMPLWAQTTRTRQEPDCIKVLSMSLLLLFLHRGRGELDPPLPMQAQAHRPRSQFKTLHETKVRMFNVRLTVGLQLQSRLGRSSAGCCGTTSKRLGCHCSRGESMG
jgi:hypothetical protein